MPELPEVETIRRQLQKVIIGKKLSGREIVAVRRRAKLLIIDFKDGSSLVFHLKMSGQLILNGQPLKHTRKIFKFNDGSTLVFNDMRKFGWWKRVKNSQILEKDFGPEALKINLISLKNCLKSHPKIKIKQFLMNQHFIAGIGNIYSDEILFASKIHPAKQAGKLNNRQIKLLHQNIKKILEKAVEYKGSSLKDYFDASGQKGDYVKYHQVYQKEGSKCSRCTSKIKRIKIAGRSAHFCPNCQKL